MVSDRQIIDRIKKMSDKDLMEMLTAGPSGYTPLALQTAKQELTARGGKEALIAQIGKQTAAEEQEDILRQQLKERRPRVPTGCKTLSILWIIGSLIIVFQLWTRPEPMYHRITTTATGVLFALCALATLLGNRFGLAVLAALLMLAGISIPAASYVASKQISFLVLLMSVAFFLGPALYLLFKWKLYGEIAKYKSTTPI
jgi:Na+/melibiose symporter-like transporter